MKSLVLLKSSNIPPTTTNDSYSLEDAYVTELKTDFIPFLVNTLSFTFFAIEELSEQLRKPEKYSGIIFTSPRAVEAIVHAVNQIGYSQWHELLLPKWKMKKIFCVGEATERNVEISLGLIGEGGSSGNAATLASYIIQNYSLEESLPLFFPCGELRREELPDILSKNSVPFKTLKVYNTTVSPTLEADLKECLNKTKSFDYAVFFSPSGVRFSKPALHHLLGSLTEIKFIAIGPTTEKALLAAELPVYKVCDKPSPSALARLLKEEA